MKYTLRNYQKQASDAAVRLFTSKADKNGLVILPTGAGKSLVIADIASRLEGPLLVFQPSKEILQSLDKDLFERLHPLRRDSNRVPHRRRVELSEGVQENRFKIIFNLKSS